MIKICDLQFLVIHHILSFSLAQICDSAEISYSLDPNDGNTYACRCITLSKSDCRISNQNRTLYLVNGNSVESINLDRFTGVPEAIFSDTG